MGDAIATNLFMLGYAWQKALVPVSFDALMRAVELNGAAIEMNKTAFAWGRLAAIDLPAVLEAAGIARSMPSQETLARVADPVAGRMGRPRVGRERRAEAERDRRRIAPPARAWRQRCGVHAARRRAPVAFAR